MLNKLLMMLSSGKNILGTFSVVIGKYSTTFEGTAFTYIGVHTVPYVYGEITPKQFLEKEINNLNTSYSPGATTNLILDIPESDWPLYRNSSMRLTRRDSGKSIILPWSEKEGVSGFWVTSENAAFFSESDVGKTISVSIIYTPPQAKTLFSGFIKAAKGWLHSLCASLFSSVEVVNA